MKKAEVKPKPKLKSKLKPKSKSPYKAPIITQKESSVGFHFMSLHQCCQRKFYLKYVCRFTTTSIASPLIQGGAFHEGKEVYYRTGRTKNAVDAAMKYVSKNKSFFYSPEEFDRIEYRIPIMMMKWIERHGEDDRKAFKFIAIEKEFRVTLPSNPGETKYVVTIKPDAVVKDKSSGLIYILETKTSGFSIDLTNNGVHYGDQATLYIYAVKKALGLDVYGVIPDIAYWNSRATSEDNIQMIRGDIVLRTERDLEVLEKSLRQEFSEISQKIEALKLKYDEDLLFRRNTYYCMSYGKPCEYADICRSKLPPGSPVPYGFAHYAKKKAENVGSYTLDNTIGIS